MGIGLALARQLIELHGGTIDAQSAGRGHGSAFTIRMPLVAWGSMHADLREPSEPLGRSTQRVLVVDDNVDAANMLSSLVETLGGKAKTAFDGLGALDAVRTFRPDLVFLDIGMPGIDGYETCRRLKAEAAGRHAYVVALTGWGQEHDKTRATDAGFDAHLTKPADPRVLEQLLTAPGHGNTA
jgi:CheY-like chemotaxis protein